MASGTIVSRILGFARAVLIAAAIGVTTDAADAFGVATQLPNNVYAIIVGGVIFLYSHILFTTKLDELSIATRHSPQPIAFFSLLIPFIGTLLCHYRLEHLARIKLQAEVDA